MDTESASSALKIYLKHSKSTGKAVSAPSLVPLGGSGLFQQRRPCGFYVGLMLHLREGLVNKITAEVVPSPDFEPILCK